MHFLKYAPNRRNSAGRRQTCKRQAKLSLTQTDLSFEISQFFSVFNAISLNMDELKALNAAKNFKKS